MSLLLGSLGELVGPGWAWTRGHGSPVRGSGQGRCPSLAWGKQRPWSGSREGFSSSTFRPPKAQGGVWLRARGAR